MSASSSARSRRGRWPVVAVHGVVASTVLVLVAVLALVVKPPAPPGIAAFAPQATKPITKAPQAQSAQFGTGAGQCAVGQVCGHPLPTPSTVASALPSVSPKALTGAAPPGLQCYTWPDGTVTQTFDPQSPPCISRWDDSKGNGGATTKGVTGTTISVAFPQTSANSSWPSLQPIVDFFNSHFQLYGRQIKIVPYPSQEAASTVSGGWNNPSAEHADAEAVVQRKVFATTDFLDPIPESAALPSYLDVLAKNKIIALNGGDVTPFTTRQYLESKAPYAWSYYPTIDQVMTQLATMTCRQLVGKPASHAPDSTMRSKTRKFAVFLESDSKFGGPLPGTQALLNILDGCGVHNPKVVKYSGSKEDQAAAEAAFSQMHTDGVTSVIFFPFGGSGLPGSPMLEAQQVGYTPEWVLIGWDNYNTSFQLKDPSTETSGAFGVGGWNKQSDLAEEPWSQANIAAGGTAGGAGIQPDGRAFYQEMLMLASGIQMAGPQLTPESFAAGLHSTTFPNPGAGHAPFYQGTVGFPGQSPVMVNDYTAFWLDTRTSGEDVSSSPGVNESRAFCEVDLGLRFTEDTWSTRDGFYQPGVCR